MWMSARTSLPRNRSRAFFERRSTWKCSTSRGRPAKSRRSMPTTRASPSRCSRRTSRRPSRPAMPVMTILSRAAWPLLLGRLAAIPASPEYVLALLETDEQHALNLVSHPFYLLRQYLVLVVGIAVDDQ